MIQFDQSHKGQGVNLISLPNGFDFPSRYHAPADNFTQAPAIGVAFSGYLNNGAGPPAE